MARRKSKELKENEDDLLFYLEYWQEFPDTFKRVAEKEIAELQNKIKNKTKKEQLFMKKAVCQLKGNQETLCLSR